MGAGLDRRPAWYQRLCIHALLLAGGLFFLLPLVWMIATSLKPLDQTLTSPTSLAGAFLATGYRATIDGRTYDVTLERAIDARAGKAIYVVQPAEPFRAGELYLTFGPEEAATSDERRATSEQPGDDPAADSSHIAHRSSLVSEYRGMFNKAELARMNALVTPAMKVLGDDQNVFDPASGRLTLRSGRQVPAKLVRRIEVSQKESGVGSQEPEEFGIRNSEFGVKEPPPASIPNSAFRIPNSLWLVREWRAEDIDPKILGSAGFDVSRAWDVLPEDQITKTVREIPENYPAALGRVHFRRSLGNTLFLCTMTVLGVVISSVIVAYGFAFLEFRGRNGLFGVTLATIMIPGVVTMIPVYLMYRHLGWIGSFKPLWVASWFGSAFFIFLLRQFFLGLPKDLLDAARIDGCSELEILWNVVVPLSRPVIAMVALFTFLGTWKDFMGPLIYLNHESQFTLSLALQSFAAEHGGTPWHLLMAASTVFSLPLILLFFLAMKTFIRGVAMTGMKG